MAFNTASQQQYIDSGGGNYIDDPIRVPTDTPFPWTEVSGGSTPNTFEVGENFSDGFGPGIFYMGYMLSPEGHILIAMDLTGVSGGDYILYSYNTLANVTYPTTWDTSDLITTPLPFCFGPGTQIATPQGEAAVETLKIGDMVRTADGRDVAVKWIGRQAIFPHAHFREDLRPVRIRAGALGNGLPHTDLTVSADHGMIIDGLVINASAMVNGDSIEFLAASALEEDFTYFHIETEAHDVVLANGSATETFIDAAGRKAFDNHQEYLDLYGVERIIPEMDRMRVTSPRLLPTAVKARLGFDTNGFAFASLCA